MAAVPLLHHTCIAALGVPTRFRNKAFARTRGANDPSARHLGSISESLIATSLLFKKNTVFRDIGKPKRFETCKRIEGLVNEELYK